MHLQVVVEPSCFDTNVGVVACSDQYHSEVENVYLPSVDKHQKEKSNDRQQIRECQMIRSFFKTRERDREKSINECDLLID